MTKQKKHIRVSKKGNPFRAGNSFGSAEFKVICYPDRVDLVIHKNHIVARSYDNVYSELFDYCVRRLGGRKDKWIE